VLRRRSKTVCSVSVTTRPPRPGEEAEGKYRFVDAEAFEELVHAKAFLEYAGYAGHLYGTPVAPVEKALADGNDVILEIEVQGARQVKRGRPEAVTIFVEPPDWQTLERRLTERATEGPDALERRLATARHELEAAAEFDYQVVNEDLEEAVEQVLAIMAPS
jgi:guanylate kinase